MPFLRSADILKIDLSNQPFIARKQVENNPLFQCPTGTTLITRSGTIGRMAYMRSDMVDTAISQDVLKVVPDENKVRSGYLYAFLNCKYGLPIVTGGTFGSIIVHIEAENVAKLPVPRLSEIEDRVDELIQEAADLRSKADRFIKQAKDSFFMFTSNLSTNKKGPTFCVTKAGNLQKRMDAAFHDPVAEKIRSRVISGKHTSVGDLCEKVYLPGIFKRIHVEDIAHGAYYHSATSIFSIEPKPKAILSRKSNLYEDVLLIRGTILIQAFGQEDGLIGRVAWAGEHLHGAATTHMFVRVIPRSLEFAGYLFAYLASDAGYNQITKYPYGGSIPHLSAQQIENMPVPLLDDKLMEGIANIVNTAHSYRDQAIDCELEARTLIERTIEEGGR